MNSHTPVETCGFQITKKQREEDSGFSVTQDIRGGQTANEKGSMFSIWVPGDTGRETLEHEPTQVPVAR